MNFPHTFKHPLSLFFRDCLCGDLRIIHIKTLLRIAPHVNYMFAEDKVKPVITAFVHDFFIYIMCIFLKIILKMFIYDKVQVLMHRKVEFFL